MFGGVGERVREGMGEGIDEGEGRTKGTEQGIGTF